MRPLLKKHITGRKVLLLLVLTNTVYAFMLLVTIPNVMQYTHGMNLFDMMPRGYDAAYAEVLLTTLGPEGRYAYLHYQLPVDFIYPLLFGITYSLLIAYFVNKLKLIDKPVLYLALLPILAGSFDYLENIGIITMLTSFPDFFSKTVQMANAFTMMKSGLSTVSFVILIVLFLVFVVRLRNSKNS